MKAVLIPRTLPIEGGKQKRQVKIEKKKLEKKFEKLNYRFVSENNHILAFTSKNL